MTTPPLSRCWRALAVLALGALAACADPRPDVEAWLACDECPVELAAVVAHGDAAIDPLVLAMYYGGSHRDHVNHVLQLSEEHRVARRSVGLTPASLALLSDSAVFVDRGRSRLREANRGRAVWALRALDTPAARAALSAGRQAQTSGAISWDSTTIRLVDRLDANVPVTAVAVTSPSRVVAVGNDVTLTARVHGPVAVPQAVTWSSSNAALVTVSATGEADRNAPGTVFIRACSVAVPTVCGSLALGTP
jgi:hypothetical protein